DSTLEEIVADIENPEVEFASEKYYRGLEELFNINIFVFNPGTTPQDSADNEDKLIIEVPRSKISHIRPYRPKRDTVLVFKHWGTEINSKIPYPHCELIISSYKAKDTGKKKSRAKRDGVNYIFGKSMTQIMYQTLFRSMRSYTW